MDDPLDRVYLEWLYDQVGPGHPNPRVTHAQLLRQLNSTEFTGWLPNDDNRAQDGLAIREEFVYDTNSRPVDEWVYLGCSFLEMLIGVARRLSFEAEGPPSEWFWHLIRNLGLTEYTDSNYNRRPLRCTNAVGEILEVVNWREYQPSGLGGLFPLKNPRENQAEAEVWRQMCSYLSELE